MLMMLFFESSSGEQEQVNDDERELDACVRSLARIVGRRRSAIEGRGRSFMRGRGRGRGSNLGQKNDVLNFMAGMFGILGV
jgi:hypothetical protein